MNLKVMEIERFRWILSGIDFEKLSEWEENFIESCEKQLKYKPELSEKQTEIIERIYQEKWK